MMNNYYVDLIEDMKKIDYNKIEEKTKMLFDTIEMTGLNIDNINPLKILIDSLNKIDGQENIPFTDVLDLVVFSYYISQALHQHKVKDLTGKLEGACSSVNRPVCDLRIEPGTMGNFYNPDVAENIKESIFERRNNRPRLNSDPFFYYRD